MKVLKFLNERLEEIFLVILMIAATLLVAAAVVTRFILKVPLPWSEEIARYMFLWLTWVGAAYATKERKHVRIDIVYEKLPEAGKKICTAISTVIWIIFLAIMVYLSVRLTASVASGVRLESDDTKPALYDFARATIAASAATVWEP